MRAEDEKSPCFDCLAHLRKLDKLDPRYPCATCAPRIAYADRQYGMPARNNVEQDIYEMHDDGTEIFRMFDDGLNISDIAFI